MDTTKVKATEPERILVYDGEADFKSYLSHFNQVAKPINEFGKMLQTELPDLKIEFGRDWFLAFRNYQAKNKISRMIDDFANTQPHSLREYVTNWHWERLNKIMETADRLFGTTYQRFVSPDLRSYPTAAVANENIPFDENGKMAMSEEFAAKIRPLFNTYAEGARAHETLAIMQVVADAYNKLSSRITEGKSHPNYRHIHLEGSKPSFIEIGKDGVYKPSANYLNTL